ncbi:conserved hypothetical protein [Acidianus hospitalis W1]|uniref:Uncharacterized protein n=1 Tax=Acidianus hospitalis (strain W1) TaxID=933801 RepID=F4B5L5_ACIHW|nr:hypothetical protein [Acidianus hospitalis]AEE94439.1 conserved hypothetical protein [Acidianus hospitalis W1]
MKIINTLFKYSFVDLIALISTFSLGFAKSFINFGILAESLLYLHISLALISFLLAVVLLKLSFNTGLEFPKIASTISFSSIVVAGSSGITFLLTNNNLFSHIMLGAFEVALISTSLLIGYLTCFFRLCKRY